MQVPKRYEIKYKEITNKKRRIHLGKKLFLPLANM